MEEIDKEKKEIEKKSETEKKERKWLDKESIKNSNFNKTIYSDTVELFLIK